MPKKNKAGKNAFFYFMMDYKGRSNDVSMQQISTEAGHIWERMGPNERRPYQDRASNSKAGEKGVKMTALHENIDSLLRDEAEKKLAEATMQNDIQNTVKRMIAANTIKKEFFHIMHLNDFCFANSTRKHYPAEIGLLRFNLEEGVLEKNIYHEIIKPGPLPLGYSYTAKVKSEESHQLPAPIGDTDCNMDLIFQTFCLFMQESAYGNDRTLPPIYVSDKDTTLVTEIVHQMCDEFGYNKSAFRIYSLQYFFFALRNNLSDLIIWPTVNQSILELERDVFDFTQGISCTYHEETDVPIHCSRSIVVRYAFIICDNCCKTVNIQMILGQHVPRNSNISSIRPNSSASFFSCNQSNTSAVEAGAASEATDGDTLCDEDFMSAFDDQSNQNDGAWEESRTKSRRKVNTSSSSSSVKSLDFQEELPSQRARAPRRPFTVSASMGPAGMSANLVYPPQAPSFGRGRGRGWMSTN